MLKDSFRMKVSDTGYLNYDKHGTRGKVVFHGLECPKCKNVFQPIVSEIQTCPNCQVRGDVSWGSAQGARDILSDVPAATPE